MLEAIVKEFGHTEQVLLSSLINENSLEHIDNALQWCSENRMRFRYLGDDTTQEYEGWNSGGQLKSLSAGEPESWATAVVYMFLWEVSQFMTKVIQARLLQKYKARQLPPGNEQWERIIDIDVIIPRETDMTVKKTLEKFIIHGAEKIPENAPGKLSGRRSVLLFGPPGTSKTQFVRALASKLTWPLIEIDPSAFLTNGIDNIYARSKEIFEDFEDLSRVVLFFDEMDALVHTRNNKDEPFDLTSRFLTTSMLPKLAKLHDDAKAVFFFATNDLDAFDPAIKRPGRFDLLLCVGPPSWNRILDELAIVVKEMNCRQEVEKLKHKLESFDNLEEPVKDTLNRLTFSETKRFIEILTENSIGELRNIDTITEDEFKKTIKELEKTITLSKSKSSESGEQADTVYKRYLIQQKSSQLQ